MIDNFAEIFIYIFESNFIYDYYNKSSFPTFCPAITKLIFKSVKKVTHGSLFPDDNINFNYGISQILLLMLMWNKL